MNTNSYPVVIIGGGQAGLAMSWSLTQKNIRHIVLERHRLAWA
ncbi:FAD-dependent monooxygenase [Klebsiella pneumoniae]|nr:FAD-dependent monooxygenase [Klebsiella pneumoniae]MCL7856188.1 FAD-dependent monooxygenase [Klebsiella pneumoniae]